MGYQKENQTDKNMEHEMETEVMRCLGFTRSQMGTTRFDGETRSRSYPGW